MSAGGHSGCKFIGSLLRCSTDYPFANSLQVALLVSQGLIPAAARLAWGAASNPKRAKSRHDDKDCDGANDGISDIARKGRWHAHRRPFGLRRAVASVTGVAIRNLLTHAIATRILRPMGLFGSGGNADPLLLAFRIDSFFSLVPLPTVLAALLRRGLCCPSPSASPSPSSHLSEGLGIGTAEAIQSLAVYAVRVGVALSVDPWRCLGTSLYNAAGVLRCTGVGSNANRLLLLGEGPAAAAVHDFNGASNNVNGGGDSSSNSDLRTAITCVTAAFAVACAVEGVMAVGGAVLGIGMMRRGRGGHRCSNNNSKNDSMAGAAETTKRGGEGFLGRTLLVFGMGKKAKKSSPPLHPAVPLPSLFETKGNPPVAPSVLPAGFEGKSFETQPSVGRWRRRRALRATLSAISTVFGLAAGHALLIGASSTIASFGLLGSSANNNTKNISLLLTNAELLCVAFHSSVSVRLLASAAQRRLLQLPLLSRGRSVGRGNLSEEDGSECGAESRGKKGHCQRRFLEKTSAFASLETEFSSVVGHSFSTLSDDDVAALLAFVGAAARHTLQNSASSPSSTKYIGRLAFVLSYQPRSKDVDDDEPSAASAENTTDASSLVAFPIAANHIGNAAIGAGLARLERLTAVLMAEREKEKATTAPSPSTAFAGFGVGGAPLYFAFEDLCAPSSAESLLGEEAASAVKDAVSRCGQGGGDFVCVLSASGLRIIDAIAVLSS